MNQSKPIQINSALQDTIQWEKNLSPEAKLFFSKLCDGGEAARYAANCLAELIQRNYVYIDGFPASAPDQGKNRTSWQLRLAGLKQLFTGKPE